MRTKWWTVWIVIIMLAIATVLGGGCQAITGKFGIGGVSDTLMACSSQACRPMPLFECLGIDTPARVF